MAEARAIQEANRHESSGALFAALYAVLDHFERKHPDRLGLMQRSFLGGLRAGTEEDGGVTH